MPRIIHITTSVCSKFVGVSKFRSSDFVIPRNNQLPLLLRIPRRWIRIDIILIQNYASASFRTVNLLMWMTIAAKHLLHFRYQRFDITNVHIFHHWLRLRPTQIEMMSKCHWSCKILRFRKRTRRARINTLWAPLPGQVRRRIRLSLLLLLSLLSLLSLIFRRSP